MFFSQKTCVFPSLLTFLVISSGVATAATPTLDTEQWAFLNAINNFRAQNGVGPLQVSATLQNSSQWMSEDMAAKVYFNHTDSLGRDPQARMAAFGYSSFTWGENIAAGYSDAQSTLNQWANSSGHRANMLNSSFTAIGIGRAYNAASPYHWYWTTDFGGTIDQVVTPPGGSGGGTPSTPVVSSFTANPQSIVAGQASTLSWNVAGATSISVNGIGTVTGTSVIIYPTQTTTYTLTAANSAGYTTASVSVFVTPPPSIDTQPPSTPSITFSTAKSATEADLTWSASSDNVGVAGYQILRNGAAIATVGPNVVSYADTTVIASTTFSYSVRAFDAANNYSAPSNAVFVTTPAAPAPPSGSTCPSPASNAFTGCYYSNVFLSGNPAYVRTDPQINFDWAAGAPDGSLPRTGYSIRWQGNFSFESGDYTFTATASDGIRVSIDGITTLDAWRDQAPTAYSFHQAFASGTHLISVDYYDRNGTSSAHLSWQLSPSAGRRGAATPSISLFTATPSAITAGQSATLAWSVSGATSITIDNGIGDVTNATSKPVSPAQTATYVLTARNDAGSASASVTVYVSGPPAAGDSQPPSMPTLFSAIAKSAGEIDLSWTASTDNTGVTAYQIFRNGTAVTAVSGSTLSYADVNVSANTLYTYAVRALDAAGNVSPMSNTVTVTTPAGTPGSNSCADPATNAFTGCYYSNLTLSGTPAIIRTDNEINFDWVNGTPARSITPYNFSVRWQGYFDFGQSEYTFTAITSDGMRVYVDGVLVIDSWRDQAPNTYAGTRVLSPGRHLVTVEYYLRTGTGAAHVTWQPGGRGGR